MAKFLVAQAMLILLINPVITACRPEKHVDACSIGPNPSRVKNRIMPLQNERAAHFAQRLWPYEWFAIVAQVCYITASHRTLPSKIPKKDVIGYDKISTSL